MTSSRTRSLNAIVDGVCNGDDNNGSQAEAPYNVRKALGIDLLPAVLSAGRLGCRSGRGASRRRSRLRRTQRIRRSRVPGSGQSGLRRGSRPTECQDAGDPKCDHPVGPGSPNGPGDLRAGRAVQGHSPGSLPFTGSDLMTLGLIGGLVMVAGLGLMALADRRRKAIA